MSHGARLAFFFAVSVALHGAGLWAAAERFEPGPADSAIEVAILDRDLFFRHVARSERQLSRSVSDADRVAAVPGDAVRPTAGESVVAAPAAPIPGSEPERPSPVTAQSYAATRPQLTTVDSTPPPRREAVAPRAASRSDQTRPDRVSGDDAAAPPAAIPPQIEPSVDPAHAEPVRAFDSLTAMAPLPIAPASEPVIQRLQRPVGAEAEPARAHDVETPARTAAEAAASPPLEAMANVPAAASPVLPPEPGAASSAEPMTAAVGAVLEPSSAWNPAGETSRVPAAPEPVPALRGTMLAPSLAPLEAQRARPVGEPAPLRPSLAAVPRRAEPPAGPVSAGPVAAGTARLAPSRAPSASRPTPVVKVAPQEIAAPPPAASGEPPPGRLDPADRFTRTYRGGECFFPVPVASQDGGAIAGYGLQAESVQVFRQAYAQRLGVEPDVDWRPITDSQCGGISFARIILGGSPPGVHIGLDRKEIGSGEDLAGRVTGSRFEFVTLLLVDDAGLVHNVLDYLRPAASGVEFSFPVHPVDDGMDRVQLIMAVSASMPLAALNRTTAVHSDDFFPELLKQAREAGALLDLGLEDFVILDRPS